MKMPFQFVGLALALVFVLVGSQAALAKDVHTGKVVFAADNKLVITDVDEVNEEFVVTEATKITRNGEAATLSDLAVDDAVKVTSMRKEGKKIALSVEARTDM